LSALLTAAAIVVTGLCVSLVTSILMGDVNERWAMAITLLAMQTTTVVLVWSVAGWFGGRRREVLALGAWPGMGRIAVACVGAMAVLAPYNLAVFWLAPDVWAADLLPFKQVIQSPASPVFLVAIVVGAPLSEELLFRGFLQSALAPSRIGFVGASAVTTILWTGLHAGYSLIGLAEVFLIGLYLAWTLWWTGSLWAPLICHAVYNGLVFALLKLVPLPF
jgi:membrane protease YdiL (CAAX protease family)